MTIPSYEKFDELMIKYEFEDKILPKLSFFEESIFENLLDSIEKQNENNFKINVNAIGKEKLNEILKDAKLDKEDLDYILKFI